MREVTLEDAKEHLSALVEDALRGEEIVIAGAGCAGVRLVPIPVSRARRQPGTAEGLIQMAEDFDAPLPDFESYTR